MNKEKVLQETIEFIETDLWDRSKMFVIFHDLIKSCCYRKTINHIDSTITQYKYLDTIKSLYLPKYEYLFLFIKNTKLKDDFIEYTREYIKKWPDDKLNEDVFRNQCIYSKYREVENKLFGWDFYTVIDYLYELIYMFKYLKENS